MSKQKLVIVGVGHVGSSVLSDAVKKDLFSEIALIDIEKDIAEGEAIDQTHATAFDSMTNTSIYSAGYEACKDADVIVISAGSSLIPEEDKTNPDRAILAQSSSQVIREVMAGITEHTKEAVIILITNPLDSMVYIAENEFDYPEGKVFGTGTMLDSARLRRVIADNYSIDPKSVVGHMMGEHGMTAFPALSRANIQGFNEEEWDTVFEGKEALDRETVQKRVVETAYDVFNLKGWTNAGIAQAAVVLAKAVVLNERGVYPVCTTLKGQYGYNGNVALSMPCIIGENGVEKQLEIELDEQETEWLHQSAAYIQEVMQTAGVSLSE